MAKLTAKQIFAAFAGVEQAVDEWEQEEGPFTTWRGQQVKAVALSVDEALAAFFEWFRPVASDASDLHTKRVVLHVDAFERELEEWMDGLDNRPNETDPAGPSSLWRALEELRACKKPPAKKLPEPIAQLLAIDLEYRKIAQIYNWYREDGEPDTVKVTEEISRPGSHFDPDTWESRQDEKRRKEIEDRWETRVEDRPGYVHRAHQASESAEKAKQKAAAPESLDELLALPGITVDQIIRMRPQGQDLTPDEVRERAAELRIPVDAQAIAMAGRHVLPNQQAQANANAREQANIRRMELAAMDCHPELADPEARALAILADLGGDVATTAELLNSVSVPVTYQGVTAMRDRQVAADAAEAD